MYLKEEAIEKDAAYFSIASSFKYMILQIYMKKKKLLKNMQHLFFQTKRNFMNSCRNQKEFRNVYSAKKNYRVFFLMSTEGRLNLPIIVEVKFSSSNWGKMVMLKI